MTFASIQYRGNDLRKFLYNICSKECRQCKTF